MSEQLKWFKSSYSDSEGSDCVEVAVTPTTVRVRDTKLAVTSPELMIPVLVWSAFISAVQPGA
ncbi:DUF397 domain-containing protein [Streptomyces vastus]|uniref:DUF397 domain-containing protein n=1 Tax=Streptomyces vastus TaxID=285451 RepID=A0ABN3QWJ9_9ACTN